MTDHESRLASGARELVSQGVLVVDRDENVHKGMLQLLAPHGMQVVSVSDPARATALMKERFFGVVVIDLDTPGPNEGLELVRSVHEGSPTSLILVLSPRKSFDAAVAAYRAGASDVVMKAPDQVDYLKQRILSGVDETARGAAGRKADVRELLDNFLKRLMEAERRTLELEEQLVGRSGAGTDPAEEVRVLVVDADDRLYQALAKARVPGFEFSLAHTGGEALDRVTSSAIHIVLVGSMLADLPGSMVVKALKSQAPELIVISFELGGKMEIVETTKTIPVLDKFTAASQLVERLSELGAAHRARVRERRYLQVFRERHQDLLRSLAAIRKKL